MLFKLFIVVFSSIMASNAELSLKPIEIFSIRFFASDIKEKSSENTFVTHYELQNTQISCKSVQVLGAITDMNLSGDQGLKMHFTTSLDENKCSITIRIYTKPLQQKQISSSLYFVFDFMIFRLPPKTYFHRFNMTKYQSQLQCQLDDPRKYQLLPFLNGFSNISLSGNVTHFYNYAGFFIIDFLTCDTELNEGGWTDGEDYLYFTVIIIDKTDVVLKFNLYSPTYEVKNKGNQSLFYGVKGTTDGKIVTEFIESSQTVLFSAKKLKKDLSYGLNFLPFSTSSGQAIDSRIHIIDEELPVSKLQIYFLIIIPLIVFTLVGFWIIGKKMLKDNEKRKKSRRDSYKTENALSCSSARSKSLNESNIFVKKNFKIDTVPEVDEGLEGSIRGSTQNQKQNLITEKLKSDHLTLVEQK